ncbi:hypothetical protein J4E93_003387 [Alternaria ventricosa]|uniref:uncharacterized protein n=1 Tax=Alternaria ventricosa TaxID=1187951 RepID=UPI0020C4A200|nr:uncharacterized protein J4E93_003387 [Alternaria ventricosa]KAI4651028.1 hypothetical protein J4E93_003387 [Alternaria ventricosa]
MEAPLYYSSKGSENATAFVNGRVYTMDDAQPWVEAFIVNPDGKFEAVGSNEEIRTIAKRRGLVQYQLQEKFVMPGIHDAHTHLLAAGCQRTGEAHVGWDSTDKTLASNIKSASCACAFSNVMGNWIIGNFYQASNFADGIPDRKYLDELYPDDPVIVREISCHRILVNTAGLREMGIDDDVKDPPGGFFFRRPDGTLTGEIVEAATTPIWRGLPRTPLSYAKTVIEFAMSECHRYGITSVQEASANTVYLHAVRELEAENRLPLNIHTHIVAAPEKAHEREESLAALLNVAEAFESKHVHTSFVKFFLDGAPLPPQSTQCDLNDHGAPDAKHLLLSYDKLLEQLLKYDARSMTCKIHAAGEGSLRLALDAYEAVRKNNPNGPKHELAHYDIPRIARLGLTAEMSPAIWHHPIVQAAPHLLKWPFNDILATGARMTIGSDWILTPNPSLFDPLAHLVERLEVPETPAHEGLNKKQIAAVTLCRMITLGGAEAVGRSRMQGSIEVGKMANFIAVDQDLSQGEFAGATVLKTWFEGRQVYSSVPGQLGLKS